MAVCRVWSSEQITEFQAVTMTYVNYFVKEPHSPDSDKHYIPQISHLTNFYSKIKSHLKEKQFQDFKEM